MPVVAMNTPSALPRSTTLVSPVTTGTPDARAASPILSAMRFKSANAKALFDDEARGEIERLRTRHRDIVDGTVHGERADVAAWEEQWGDHVAVGRHHHAAGGDVERALGRCRV